MVVDGGPGSCGARALGHQDSRGEIRRGGARDAQNLECDMGRLAVLSLVTGVVRRRSRRPSTRDPAEDDRPPRLRLVSRMTLEEKASQLVNRTRPSRVSAARVQPLSEALHGVANTGTHVFPAGDRPRPSFDAPLVARWRRLSSGKRASSTTSGACRPAGIFQGSLLLANINIVRDPRWAAARRPTVRTRTSRQARGGLHHRPAG